MIWALFAIIHSLCRSVQSETNRVFHAEGWGLWFWQSFFGMLFLLPLAPFVLWPIDREFYMAAAGVALIHTVGVLIQLNLATRKSGRISCIYMPVEAIAAALLWMFINPSLLDTYKDNNLMTICVVAAFAMTGLATFRIRPADVNRDTLLVVLPVALTYAMAAVVTKIVFPEQSFAPAILSYVTVNYMVMVIVTGPVFLLKEKTKNVLLRPDTVKAGAICGVASVLAYASFIAAVVAAPNPGYVSVAAMLLPVWIMIWHGVSKKSDDASPLAAFFIAIGVLILVLASGLNR